MQELSRKNALFTDSVIRRMTRVALDCGAINLAQGFPDFDPPKAMTDRLAEVAHTGPHQYPITMGAPNFREALARKCGRFMGRELDPNTDMVVTIGSTEAMVDTIFALTNPGDRIVMFSPYFENYRAQAIMADCEPVFIPLVPPEFNFDPDIIEAEFKKGAKAILICNPSNPSGKVFTYDELRTIADLCIKYDVYAIMDEVYEHIIYEGHKHIYMNSLDGMWERTVSCSSLSKTYSVTGWRLGYAIAPKPLMDRIKQYHDFNAVGAASPLMEAACVGLQRDLTVSEFLTRIRRAHTLYLQILPRSSSRVSRTLIFALKWLKRLALLAFPVHLSSTKRASIISFVFTLQRRMKPSMRLSKDFHTSRKRWDKNKILSQYASIMRYWIKRKSNFFRLSFSFCIQCGIIL